MSKYTSGKWKITLHKTMATLEKDCMPGVELPIATIEFHRGKETDEANAHLIASAPELLEACKNILKIYYDTNVSYRHEHEKIIAERCEQAIAKAEGE